MGRIRNVVELKELLINEKKNWQNIIFETTGVVVLPTENIGSNDWRLFSCCGESDLSALEYGFVERDLNSEDCSIKSIGELIEYITQSGTYNAVLQDINFGRFRKSELFWAIQYRIMYQNCYGGNPSEQIYGMRSISTEGNTLWFDISACGLDEIPGIEVQLSEQDTLDSVVEQVAKQIKDFRDSQLDWKKEEYPLFTYDPAVEFIVPRSFEEVCNAMRKVQY